MLCLVTKHFLQSHYCRDSHAFNLGNIPNRIAFLEQPDNAGVLLLLLFFGFAVAGLSSKFTATSFIEFTAAVKTEFYIVTFQLGYRSKNGDEYCKEGMFFALLVEYAQVLFLKIDIKSSLLAKHHIFQYLIYISSKSGEF